MPAIPLMNPAVKAALDALKRGDRSAWKSLFTRDAERFDDGRPRSLTEFSDEAVGHERFTKLSRRRTMGVTFSGRSFRSTGNFRTYFKFHLTQDQKIRRLDIGQAAYVCAIDFARGLKQAIRLRKSLDPYPYRALSVCQRILDGSPANCPRLKIAAEVLAHFKSQLSLFCARDGEHRN